MSKIPITQYKREEKRIYLRQIRILDIDRCKGSCNNYVHTEGGGGFKSDAIVGHGGLP